MQLMQWQADYLAGLRDAGSTKPPLLGPVARQNTVGAFKASKRIVNVTYG